MRKRAINLPLKRFVLVLLLIGVAFPLCAKSIGGGISFFVPETLYDPPNNDWSGSVSKEAGLSTSFGLGDYLAIPVGFTYIKASGIMGYEKKDNGDMGTRIAEELWYTADTFIPYLRAEAHIPIGPVFVEGFAGVAGTWFVAPQVNEGAFGRDLATDDSTSADFYTFSGDFKIKGSLGYGYQFGGAFGVRIDKISVKLSGTYSDLRAKSEAKSDKYWEGTYGSSVTKKEGNFSRKFWSRLRGFSIGINGSYEM